MDTPLPRQGAFLSVIGQPFDVEVAPGQHITLTLTTVTEASPAGSMPVGVAERDRFSLLFSGPPQPSLPQAIYTFAHATLGTHAIFIVPVGRDERGLVYEAVFG